jgi:hypothetical protein
MPPVKRGKRTEDMREESHRKMRKMLPNGWLIFLIAFAITHVAVAHDCCSPDTEGLAVRKQLYITEIGIRPPSAKDWPVWVEIWNHRTDPVDLTGYTMSTLQTNVSPFTTKTVLASEERCVILFYAGDGQSNAFERMIPATVKVIRHTNTSIFPPLLSHDEWIKKLSAEEVLEVMGQENRPLCERKLMLDDRVATYIGSTRYANEVTLRSPAGTLICYAAWGDRRSILGKDYRETPAYQEALNAQLIGLGWSAVPPRIASTEHSAAVVQLYAHGFYRPLVVPERDCSPGRALHINVPVPEALPVGLCSMSHKDGMPSISLKLPWNASASDLAFEAMLGWSAPDIDICIDEEMTKPVFKSDINQLGRSMSGHLGIWLNPVDYFCLDGRKLYWRISRRNVKTGEVLSSNVQSFTMQVDRGTIPVDAKLVHNQTWVQVDYAAAGVDRTEVARTLSMRTNIGLAPPDGK